MRIQADAVATDGRAGELAFNSLVGESLHMVVRQRNYLGLRSLIFSMTLRRANRSRYGREKSTKVRSQLTFGLLPNEHLPIKLRLRPPPLLLP